MRHGIHRGTLEDGKDAERAWVSEAPGEAGEWLTEAQYRASGLSPDYDSLMHLVVQRLWVLISDDELAEVLKNPRP